MRLRHAWLGLAALAVLAAEHPANATSCVPGFDYGAFASCGVTMSGGGVTNSYDSSIGPYSVSQSSPASNGNLGENCTTANSIDLSGSTTDVHGNIDIGPGGSSGSVIKTSGGATYSSSGNLGSTLNLTPVTIPVTGTDQGNLTCNSNCSPATNQTYDTVKVQSSGTNITLSAGTYVMDSFSMSGNSILTVGSGPIIVYIACVNTTNNALDLSGGSVANSTQKSTNLVFMLASTCSTASISGGGSASYAVYAPDTDVTISGGGTIYGAVVAKSVKDTGGSAIYYDKALKNFVGGGFSCSATEVSRASPVVATISSQTSLVQGTYESPTGLATTLTDAASISTWTFPWIKGHVRARVASTVTSASFSSGTVQFDAATTGNIPTTITTCSKPYTGTCRGIFTNTNATAASGTTFGSGLNVTAVDYTNSTTSTALASQIVSGLTAANYQSIVQKIQQAGLGGVDRSTVAVIQASTYAGSGSRPTVAYFGALDGMLHAVCASTGGSTATVSTNACPSLGKELWAFLPRVQLPLLAGNVGRIDGSVRVTDIFGDFTSGSGTGTKSWRTILTFQTGFGIGATPAVYAIDVTDPNSPTLLWEVTAPGTSPGTIDVGTGLTMAEGPTLINGRTTNLTLAETNNGGTQSATNAAMAATAINTETGNKQWQFTYSYPSPPRGVAADLPMALIGIPGGGVGVDLTGYGYFTDFVMGDLYGDLWLLNASTGVSRNGTTTPLFSFSVNKMPIGAPPAVYSNGTSQFAAFASGGYADPTSTAWTTTGQRIIAVKLQYVSGNLNETGGTSSLIPVNQTFSGVAANDKSYAQVLIVGTQLFVTSDSSDVNLSSYGTSGAATGHLTTVDLGGSTATTVMTMTPVANGAGSVVNNTAGTQVYGAYQLGTTNGSTGTSVDLTANAKMTRNLWLRTR